MTVVIDDHQSIEPQGGVRSSGDSSRPTPGGAFRPFPDDLPTLAECRKLLMSRVPGPPADPERGHLAQISGRVLAEDIYSAEDIPAFDRATMDGYAVYSEDIKGTHPDAGVNLKLSGGASAGQVAAAPLDKGAAFGVATGAMLPIGADAVVPGEYCRVTNEGSVTVLRALPPGANILARGSDLTAGQLALSAGTILKPPHIGVLASLGKTEATVYPRPIVSIIATGDELVHPEALPGPGQVRDSNSYSLAAALERDGAVVRIAGIMPDEPDTLTPRLEQELDRADIVLIIGGSSVGKADFTRDALSALGTETLFHGLKLKPGKPALIGIRRGTMVAGMPGNPVSALAIYYVLVRPILRKLLGWHDPLGEVPVLARLTQTIRRPTDREELVRVKLNRIDGQLWAEPVPGTSGMLHSMSRADGQILISMEQMEFKAGEIAEVWLFD